MSCFQVWTTKKYPHFLWACSNNTTGCGKLLIQNKNRTLPQLKSKYFLNILKQLIALRQDTSGGRSFSYNPRWRPISLATGNVKRQCQCSVWRWGMDMLMHQRRRCSVIPFFKKKTKGNKDSHGFGSSTGDSGLGRGWGGFVSSVSPYFLVFDSDPTAWWILIPPQKMHINVETNSCFCPVFSEKCVYSVCRLIKRIGGLMFPQQPQAARKHETKARLYSCFVSIWEEREGISERPVSKRGGISAFSETTAHSLKAKPRMSQLRED